jgi:LysR family transcriptional regulator, cell division regulator
MDAADLAVFAAVARDGAITRAARTLNTVQSNVTQRIRLLEAELGVPLFHRQSRGVTLTSAGSRLLPYAERIIRLIDEAKRVAADGPLPRGQITIGALETATAVRLPPILSIYAAACPEVDIRIHTGTGRELTEAVLAHRLEAAFVAGPVSHSELLALPLLEEQLVLVTAAWVTTLDGLTTPPAGGVKIVVFRSGCSYRARLEGLLAARGALNIRLLEFGTLDGIIGCVGAGIGVTMLPRAVVARAEAEGRVALHALPADEARVETVLVRRRDVFVSTALSRFIEIAREHLALSVGTHQTAGRGRSTRSAGRLANVATTSDKDARTARAPRLKSAVPLPTRSRTSG